MIINSNWEKSFVSMDSKIPSLYRQTCTPEKAQTCIFTLLLDTQTHTHTTVKNADVNMNICIFQAANKLSKDYFKT